MEFFNFHHTSSGLQAQMNAASEKILFMFATTHRKKKLYAKEEKLSHHKQALKVKFIYGC